MRKYLPITFFIVSIIIHLFYYYSAFFGNYLDLFFENVTMGQDFFSIPNGAYSFLNGGTLNGVLPGGIEPYIACCGVNSNVYHPFFTLATGSFLQLFEPWTSFSIWVIIHLLFSVILIFYLWINYKKNNNIFFALSLYLLNSYHFYEIKHAQYHFFLAFFTTILISEILKNKNNLTTGFLYFLSLLVKPIGVLWIVPLFLYRRFATLIIGIFMFISVTVPFLITNFGEYYVSNVINVSNQTLANYNLMALSHFLNFNTEIIKLMMVFTAVILLILQLVKKPNPFYIFFLWISFQLVFYSLVFHYHYTILPPLFALGILLNLFSIKKLEILPIIFLTLPSPVIFFRLLGSPAILPQKELALVALWSVFWLTFLMLITFYKAWNSKTFHFANLPREKTLNE